MKNLSLILAGIAALGLSACATGTPPKKVAELGDNVKIVGKTGTTRNVNEDGKTIICKRDYETGSRVRFTEICGTEKEWEIIREDSANTLKDMTGDRAASNSR